MFQSHMQRASAPAHRNENLAARTIQGEKLDIVPTASQTLVHRMATTVNTLTTAEDHRERTGAGVSNSNPASTALMTGCLPMPDIDMIKFSATGLGDDILVHDYEALNESQQPIIDIRKGIPSLPQIWAKRVAPRKARHPSKVRLAVKSTLRQSVTPSEGVNRPVVEQVSKQSSQQIAEESIVQRKPVTRGPTQQTTEGLEVRVPLQLKERLKTLNLSSSLQLIVDDNAEFQSTDLERLKHFNHFLDQNGSALFRGLPSRNLLLTLVAVTDPSTSWPYICIKGLMKDSEITSFHAILSQRSVRAYYKPLKLCYDKGLVERAASGATYQTNMSDTSDTLCGTLLRTEEPGQGVWISTIGGIIEVDKILYAVTTAHYPSIADSNSDESTPASTSSSPGSSVADTLVEEGEIDPDVEPALIIDTWKEQENQRELAHASTSSQVLLPRPPKPTNPFFWPDLGNTTVLAGSDWRLLTIDPLYQLPNCIPFQRSALRIQQGGEGQILANDLSPRYLQGYPILQSKRRIFILAGVSGICPGILLGNISFLRLRGEGSRLVWSAKLDKGFGM
jgi:hypothetical protein